MIPQQPARPAASNGLAIASLVIGIVSWVVPGEVASNDGFDLYYHPVVSLVMVVGPILAVVFGHIGLARANRGAKGRGLAIAGMVLGYLILVAEIIGLIVAVAS